MSFVSSWYTVNLAVREKSDNSKDDIDDDDDDDDDDDGDGEWYIRDYKIQRRGRQRERVTSP